MKKILTITLALILALGLTACGESDVDNDTSTGAPSTTQPETVTSDEGETVSDTSDATENSSTDSNKNESKPQTESSQPVASSNPTTSSKPATSSKPTVSSTPSETSKPTESSKPEVTNNIFFNANNSNYDLDSVSIKPRYVYWENGELVAECFVINGFSHNVFNIDVKSITFSNSSGVIASGIGFGVLKNVTLAPFTNIVWTFRFAPDAVANYGANLSTLTCNASVSNSY